MGLRRRFLGALPGDLRGGAAAMKNLHAANGRIYAQIGDDHVLRKSEKQCDRLRITGNREHAIDEALLQECLRLRVERLEIKERGDDGVVRMWRIDLADLLLYGKKRTLRGIERRTIPLVRCDLVYGSPEPWYLAERHAMQKEQATPKKPEAAQLGLFGTIDHERRVHYET